jgi:hypothetical protein
VEEIGRDFSQRIVRACERSENPVLKKLAERFRAAISEFDYACNSSQYRKPEKRVVEWHRNRFVYLADFLHDHVTSWDLAQYVNRDSRVDTVTSTGLVLSICPVGTLDRAGEVREANPASLMHLASERPPNRQWLLVTTEARGRRASRHEIERPHLIGVRVFRSVQSGKKDGRPYDRISHFNALFTDESVNIAAVTGDFKEAVHRAETNLTKWRKRRTGA